MQWWRLRSLETKPGLALFHWHALAPINHTISTFPWCENGARLYGYRLCPSTNLGFIQCFCLTSVLINTCTTTHHCKPLHSVNLPRIHPHRFHNYHHQCCSGKLHRWRYSHMSYDHYIGTLRMHITVLLEIEENFNKHSYLDRLQKTTFHAFLHHCILHKG